MAKPLPMPDRPLPEADYRWMWEPAAGGADEPWFRIYHRAIHTPDGVTFRQYGPLYRFDHHTPPFDDPQEDPEGRSVLYVAPNLATSACEVFGETGVAALCSNRRVAQVRPTREIVTFDLAQPGSAMDIGALPTLATGDLPRELTQAWAQAIYEDNPTSGKVEGIRYHTAYFGDISLVLWDCPDAVETLIDSAGMPLDLPLSHPDVRLQLIRALEPRGISVTSMSDADCPECERSGL